MVAVEQEDGTAVAAVAGLVVVVAVVVAAAAVGRKEIEVHCRGDKLLVMVDLEQIGVAS
jgi:hypothetical protein